MRKALAIVLAGLLQKPVGVRQTASSGGAATLLIVLLAVQAGCGGSESPAEPETPVATTVALTPTTLNFSSAGETQQLTPTVSDQNGATISGASVTWASSASTVASVSSTGFVSAVADGTATITAASGSASGTASVTVLVLPKIAFRSDRDGNQEIYVMGTDGSNPVRLTNNVASDAFPAWSPDGSKIVFVSTRDGNEEIYVMDADGSNPVRLTNNTAQDRHPVWSPVR